MLSDQKTSDRKLSKIVICTTALWIFFVFAAAAAAAAVAARTHHM